MKNIPKAGEVVELEQFIMSCPYTNRLVLGSGDWSKDGYPTYGKATVTFTMPNGDAIKAMVTALESQIQEERANHHVKITQLEGKIQQLLAIGHDGGVV